MPATAPTSPPSDSAMTWQIKLLYDGDCPLCLREVNFLRKQDNGRGLVVFTDIAADDYNAAAHGGVDFATAMERIHAVKADGTVINNVEVFRQIYEVLGLGWIYAPTRWPLVGPLVDWAYRVWAHWRLALTGRPSLKTLVAEREARRGTSCGIASDGSEPRCQG
jgi:predicted DCC family thiol-disulfide oxidoreductase YuxK